MSLSKQEDITTSGREPVNAPAKNEQVDVYQLDGDDQPDPYTEGLRLSFQQPGGTV